MILTLISFAIYFVFSYVDYSSNFFLISRATVIGSLFFYYLHISTYIFKHRQFSDHRIPQILTLLLFLCHLAGVIFGIEKMNGYFLDHYNARTVATIKGCFKGKSDYCIYGYTVNNTYYESRISTTLEDRSFTEGELIMIIYYPGNPVINKLE